MSDEAMQDLWQTLTPRELQVVRLIADGHTNKTAAHILMIFPRTVETYRLGAVAKLGVKTRAGLAAVVAAVPPSPPVSIETFRPRILDAHRQISMAVQQALEAIQLLERLLDEMELNNEQEPFIFSPGP